MLGAAQRHNPVPAKAVGVRDARTHAPGSEHRRARHHRLCRIEYLPKTRCMQSVTFLPLALNQDAHHVKQFRDSLVDSKPELNTRCSPDIGHASFRVWLSTL